MLSDQCRLKWLMERDRSSAFFHAILQMKHINKPLSSLLINGAIVHDADAIQHHALQYYKSLFNVDSHRVVQVSDVSDFIPNLVWSAKNVTLIALPLDEEVWSFVFSLESNSALGPDCFPGIFYQKTGHIIGGDFF